MDVRVKPDCFKCAFFKVTWDPVFPRACSKFGFKGVELPSDTVHKTTGQVCQGFEAKGSGPPGFPEHPDEKE